VNDVNVLMPYQYISEYRTWITW